MTAHLPGAASTPPQQAASVGFNRLQWGVVVLGTLVILAYAGSSAFDAWRSYHYTLLATEREIGNVAAARAEQTAWTLKTVDLLLLDTARWYSGENTSTSPLSLDAPLAARASGVPTVQQLLIADAAGRQLMTSRSFTGPLRDVSDRSYFKVQRDGTAGGLFISEPIISRAESRPAIVLSRRLEDGAHRFAGIVAAAVSLDELHHLYSTVEGDPGTAIQLMQDNGTLLVRNPPVASAVGRPFPALVTPSAARFPQLTNPLTGRTDFIAVAPVDGTPLKVAVTRDAAVALRPWREETDRVAVRALILTLLGALTIAVLLRQLRRVAVGERALRDSEERYALAMEGANEGHFDWDVVNDRLFLSPTMKVLGGLAPDAPIASRTEWLRNIEMHPDDRARFEARLRDHFEGRTPRYECEYRARHADGSWHWLQARGRCLRDAQGKPTRFVGSAIDITAQKQAQIEKEQLESQLRQSQKMEAIGTLAGGIAHDFNNILGAILGYAELAVQHTTAGSELRRYLDNVMHATERAKMLVERILGFSRSGLGDQVLFNVQAVVSETLELLQASLPADIRLQRRLEAGNAAVVGDPTDLHQVTMNLCTNALQAMERGGELRVSLERCELLETRTLLRGSLPAGPYVRLAVDDTGSGIAPDIMERIFDPFFTTKGVGRGTGLGLSLVHGIVSDLGGAIDVSSEVGVGTHVDIWLPIAGEMAIPAAEASGALPLGAGQTVMVVDDERALVALAEEGIARLGYEPVGFESSLAALRAFEAAPERFDAVVTDESMPDLLGTELARRIRRLRPSIPIILMTGHVGVQLSNRECEVGVRETLRKPLHHRDLAEALARVFGSSG